MATKLTMNRQGIRQLASDLKLPTSPFAFASEPSEYIQAIGKIGIPCVVKPVVSSSGKGQSIVHSVDEVDNAWEYALHNARGKSRTIIVESFVDFDYEITLLTVRHQAGTSFCAPIGHIQKDGDYQYSWQPHAVPEKVLAKAQYIAQTITDALGGYGIFGVELFIKGDEVLFNEVSPRPHDTGMVTLMSQNYTQFDLHLRAILGLPIPSIQTLAPTASAALLLEGKSDAPNFNGIAEAMKLGDVRIFGKPKIHGKRRMGVALTQGESVEDALDKVKKMRGIIKLMEQ
jgi:phosphoribosylglycinamide formyltransferase 2